MNEKINLVEILKDAKRGTKLYSPLFGEVKLLRVSKTDAAPIATYIGDDQYHIVKFCEDGRYDRSIKTQECMLYPSKEQRDWTDVNASKYKFDPKTLQPFDKVLGRDDESTWYCDLYSHSAYGLIVCAGHHYRYCIPYNEETKNLVGTKEEAPEYYRYWED